MAKNKKREKSHRSPDWRPKVKREQTRVGQREAKAGIFPVWGIAFFGANIGLLTLGGTVSVLVAAAACLLDWMVLKKPELPAANKLLYCLLILVGSWVLWFVLTLVWQAVFGA